MRTKLSILAAAAVLMVAGAAKADTISLVWQGGGTTISATASTTITADVVLSITTPTSIFGIAWSVSYNGSLALVSAAGSCGGTNCGGAFTPGSPGWFDLALLNQGPDGPGPSYVSSWAQDSAGGPMPVATVTVGTVTFHVTGGSFGTATPLFQNPAAGDGCFDSTFTQGACNPQIGFAGVNVIVPEPATLGFVSLGLAGLALVGRRARRR